MLDLTSDLDVLAATIYGESRGETTLAKQAVASVIMNRAAYAKAHRYPEFGNGMPHSACLKEKQFDCWDKDDPNYDLITKLDFTKPTTELTDCLNVAHDALNCSLIDPTDGCLFYKVTLLRWPKDWGKQVPADMVIGHQSFYRLGLKIDPRGSPVVATSPAPQEADAEPAPTFWHRIRAWFA